MQLQNKDKKMLTIYTLLVPEKIIFHSTSEINLFKKQKQCMLSGWKLLGCVIVSLWKADYAWVMLHSNEFICAALGKTSRDTLDYAYQYNIISFLIQQNKINNLYRG